MTNGLAGVNYRSSARWAAVALIALSAIAQAGTITFANVCEGYTVSKRGDDVLIRCPGKAEPWMTFRDCRNPRVDRSAGQLSITCTA